MKTAVIIFFFSLATYASPLEQILNKAQKEKWHENPQWVRLLHYRPNIVGGLKSQADSEKFFLHENGATHAELELQATIQALLENSRRVESRDGKSKEPVACVFPARKMWLEKQTGISFPQPECERFRRFKEILQPQSLTYVFSSYYLNNPASGFGHTFLRVNKAPSAQTGERYELADYGIGYAAVMISDNPFVYSVLGLVGMMPGVFDVNPYYFKVREYNDFESRDLWEYDLNFSKDEVDLIIAHIWELSEVNFDYYYFSENCAYRILSIFEVARPQLNLVENLKSQVMPADTVQLVAKSPGLVSNIHYRPSVRATFQNRYRQLTKELQSRITAFSKFESIVALTENLEAEEKKSVLDAAIDYIDYRYPQEILRQEGKYKFKKEILLARAETGGVSELLDIRTPADEAPDKAHGSRRISLGYRSWQDQDYALLGVKLSLHDLLDPKIGYPPTAQITMGDFTVSWNSKTKEVALDKATIFEVISLAPIDDFTKSPSWRLYISSDRGFENGCHSPCRWTEMSGGIGMTKSWFEGLDLSVWLRTTGQTSNDFKGETWRIGVGPSAMLRWNRDQLSILAESYYRYDYKGVQQETRTHELGVQWTPIKNLGLRLISSSQNSTDRLESRLMYYY